MLFKKHMSSIHPELEQCPYCGAKGECRIFAYYQRYLIDFVNGHPLVVQIRILRVICSCGTTHAILPDPIIPYEQHSLFFILRVLAEYLFHFKTIEQICEAYEISTSTFYRWKRLYKDHRKEWQGTLAAIESSLRDSLLAVVRKEPFSLFAISFFKQTGFSFLQSHKNPTPYQRRAKPEEALFP